jgi:hypothetical protein
MVLRIGGRDIQPLGLAERRGCQALDFFVLTPSGYMHCQRCGWEGHLPANCARRSMLLRRRCLAPVSNQETRVAGPNFGTMPGRVPAHQGRGLRGTCGYWIKQRSKEGSLLGASPAFRAPLHSSHSQHVPPLPSLLPSYLSFLRRSMQAAFCFERKGCGYC